MPGMLGNGRSVLTWTADTRLGRKRARGSVCLCRAACSRAIRIGVSDQTTVGAVAEAIGSSTLLCGGAWPLADA